MASYTSDFAAEPDATAEVTEGQLEQAKWLGVIEQHDKAFGDWKLRVRKLWKIYNEERRNKSDSANTRRKMSLFWSNISTLQPAIYAKTPEPSVSRRFKDDDPVTRAAAELIERSLITSFDIGGFDETMRRVRDDYLVCGRGCAWVRYEAETQEIEGPDGGPVNEHGEPLGEDESPAEEIAGEKLCYDYVNWDDFGHNVARTWDEVTCVWRRAYMTRKEGRKRFGEVFDGVQLDQRTNDSPGESDNSEDTRQAARNKATVYEIWDKTSNKVYFIARGAKEPLEVVDPYLQLQGFFPCPKPAYGTIPTNSLIPTPDYVFYQDQVEEIDDLTSRIGALLDQLKIVGLYPAGSGDTQDAIQRIAQPGVENVMVPVPNWAQFKEGGGSKGSIEWWPVEQVITVLKACFESRKMLIDDVYQITGISDIMRGEGDKSETATAQNLKSQWGSIRIRDRQHTLAFFARDCARIAAEIMAEKFQPETLLEMSNLKLPTQADVDAQMAEQRMMQMQQQQMQPPQAPQAAMQ